MEEQEHLAGLDVKNCNKTPINITFQNISYNVSVKRNETKKILQNVSGRFTSGKLTAILGPSGAGKTSLINILAGIKTKSVTGKILINNEERNLNKFQWQSSYIGQESSMLPLLTIKETLSVAAELKLPSKYGNVQKKNTISEIIDLLALEKSADTKVCDLSGGELKRLSIGVELVTNPPVMFFDEPTSGLDSVSSAQVVAHLQNLARGGRTIICVIHQPSSRLFDMFDDLIVLSNGKSIYSGSIRDMIPVFESSGFIYPQYYNRADFALEVATYELKGDIESLIYKSSSQCLSNGTTTTSSINGIDNLINKNNSINYELTISVDDATSSAKRTDLIDYNNNSYAVSQLKQFFVLFKRSNLCTLRDLQLTRLRVLAHIFVGVMLGLIYYDIGNEGSKVMSNVGLVFFFLLFIFFANSMPTVLTFPLEANVFRREHQNNWYSLFAYFSSKLIADFPLQLICPTGFLVVAYYMSGQPMELFRIGMVWIICVMFAILSQLLGLVTGAVFNMQMGIFLLPALSIPMLIFSGFLLHFDDIPHYMRFLTYISYFGYGFEGLILALYGYNRPDLNCSEPFCYIKTAQKLLEEMDMTEGNYFNDVIFLGVWIVFLQVTLFLALMYRIWRQS